MQSHSYGSLYISFHFDIYNAIEDNVKYHAS